MSKQNFFIKASTIYLFCSVLLVNGDVQEDKYNEEAAKVYLKKINKDIQIKTTESVLASWAYESNITDENLRNQLDISAKLANFTKEIWKETIKFPWKDFQDPDVRRQFQKFSVLGTAILSPEKYERFNKIISDMQSIYGKAKICNYFNRTNCSLQLEPELTEIFVKSRDPDELRYYWEEWRNAAGRPVRQMYKEYINLANEAAMLNNFTNNAEFWLKDYEAPDFKEQVETLWEQLRPLYLQLHAYVRRRLREQYGEKHVTKRGPIPAHLLGNMWAQSWANVFDLTAPYPGKPSTDVTPNMVEQGYTPLRMFKLAEQFFTSLNLSPMPDTFWKNSILEKPKDGRDLICHASAWDFYDGKDFRIKQCTRITMEDLNTVHHEMGHIQYFLQYKNQPLVYKEGTNPGRKTVPTERIKQCTRVTFRQLVTVHHEMGHIQYYLQYKNQPKIYRRGANPGFHEAVGDVMALSVSTPKHLRKIGLLDAAEDDAESEINQLFTMALDKIAFLPFGYLMDQWRWGVFEGKITEKDYNCKWWQLRERYQGLSPSVVRTEADFDPGAKYHTVGSVPYIRYFVSFVIQFQFHRSLCIAAKEYDPSNPAKKPLHKCDIYQSKEAGALLKEMLQMGSSKPWPDAMEVMTGQRKMDAGALLDYFATLREWLEKENKETNEFIGWESSQKVCEWEKDSEGVTPSLISQGNFEDDNVAFSYAEFVRQDDNAFGFPDYLEESEPSYFALPHKLKENELKNSEILTTKNSANTDEGKNSYLTKNFQLENKNDYDIKFDRHEIPNRMKKQKSPDVFENDGYNCNNNPSAAWPNTVFDLATKRQEIERSKIRQALQRLRNRQNELRLGQVNAYLQAFEKKTKTNLEGPEISAKSLESSSLRSKYFFPLENIKEDLQKSKLNNILQTDSNNEESTSKLEPEKNYKSNNDLSYKNQDATSGVLETLKTYSKLYLKPNSELIQKAEAVKNQAVEMLKNFNFSSQNQDQFKLNLAASHPLNLNLLSKLSPIKEAEQFSALSPLLGQNTLKSDLEKNNLFKISPKNSVVEFVEKNSNSENPCKEDKWFSIIPNRLLRKKLLNLQDEQKSSPKKNEETHNSYIMFTRRLINNDVLDNSKSRLQKKSYKEFSSKVKSPVVYNAVVITANGKENKVDDSKNQWSKINNGMTSAVKIQKNLLAVKSLKKRFERSSHPKRETFQNILRKKFYNSANNYKYNINNRFQYFGRLLFWNYISNFLC